MKGFIEVPYEEGNVLINVRQIVMVEPLEFGNGVSATEIYLTGISEIETKRLKAPELPDFISHLQGRKVSVILPYADVLRLIEESLR